MNYIDMNDLLQRKDGIIIDIRSKSQYLKNHIPGAISIEEKELFFSPEKYLNKMNLYYIYCSSGRRSKFLTSWLNHKGFHTVNVDGGFYNYLLKK